MRFWEGFLIYYNLAQAIKFTDYSWLNLLGELYYIPRKMHSLYILANLERFWRPVIHITSYSFPHAMLKHFSRYLKLATPFHVFLLEGRKDILFSFRFGHGATSPHHSLSSQSDHTGGDQFLDLAANVGVSVE